jgi:hypothetical protein
VDWLEIAQPTAPTNWPATHRTRHTGTMPAARELGPNDLVWDHFSRPRRDDVVARSRAAAAAVGATGSTAPAKAAANAIRAALATAPLELVRMCKELKVRGFGDVRERDDDGYCLE